MSCVVKLCKNRSDRIKKNQGITFHRFPKENEVWRDDWTEVIRKCNAEKEWIPHKFSVVCSCHFEAKDLYTTKGGLQRIVKYAVPTQFLYESTLMAEKQPVAIPDIPSTSQESATMTAPASMVLKQEEHPGPERLIWLRCEPYISYASKEIASMAMTAPMVLKQENPLVLKQEEQPVRLKWPRCEPNISNATQESAPMTVPALDVLEPMVLLKQEQPEELNITFSPEQERFGADEQLIQSELNTRTNWILKQRIIKQEVVIKRQKRKIRTINQKTNRLQSRNKSLKNTVKLLKDKIDTLELEAKLGTRLSEFI